MRHLVFRVSAGILVVALLGLVIAVVFTPGEPGRRAASMIEEQGYTAEAIQVRYDHLEEELKTGTPSEGQKKYDAFIAEVDEALQHASLSEADREQITELRNRADIIVLRLGGTLDLTASSDLSKLVRLAIQVGNREGTNSIRSRLDAIYTDLKPRILQSSDNATSVEYMGSIYQHASLLAYLLDKPKEGREIIQGEGELILQHIDLLSSQFTATVTLPSDMPDAISQRYRKWKLERGRILGDLAVKNGFYPSSVKALRQMASDDVRRSEFASYFDAHYFDIRTTALMEYTTAGSSGPTSQQLRDDLEDLFKLAIAVTEAEELTADLRNRLTKVYAALKDHLSDVKASESKSAVVNELAFLAFVLGDTSAATEWVQLQNELGQEQDIYTLQELANSEVADYTIRGNGNYTSMDLVFTDVSREITVVVYPTVLNYPDSDSEERYQDMAIYTVEFYTISQHRTVTIPALCLDRTAKTPTSEASAYETVSFQEYNPQTEDTDTKKLRKLILTLQFLNMSLDRLQASGLRGEWNVLLDVPQNYWEGRLSALIVWGITNPGTDIIASATRELATKRMTDYLRSILPLEEMNDELREALDRSELPPQLTDNLVRLTAEGLISFGKKWKAYVDETLKSGLGEDTAANEVARRILQVLEEYVNPHLRALLSKANELETEANRQIREILRLLPQFGVTLRGQGS